MTVHGVGPERHPNSPKTEDEGEATHRIPRLVTMRSGSSYQVVYQRSVRLVRTARALANLRAPTSPQRGLPRSRPQRGRRAARCGGEMGECRESL
jgi:hypothetical protein